MKKIFPIVFLIFVFLSTNSPVLAKSVNPEASVDIEGTIGEFDLNVSGYIAPYASIVLTSDGIFYRATVANSEGYFYISNILIKKGFSHFCLEAIDFKRLGESVTCFNFPPAEATVNLKDVFLPPTIGLSRNEVGEGGEIFIWGYSMPGASVTIHLSNGKKLVVTADETGYYVYKLTNIKAGKYELYSTAEYNSKQSLTPDNKVTFTALTWWEQLVAYIKELFNKVWRFFTSLSLGPLWIGLPIIISIIILIIKLWPEKFSFIYDNKLIAFFPRRKGKKLHHSWWMGY
ncbi:MAG: hypothetical protein V1697_02930 [Candidatus Levyibacteriota bacterium]